MATTFPTGSECAPGIPNPIVKLNRSMLLTGAIVALVLGLPAITTTLFAIVALAAIFGRRGSLVYALGSRLFAARNLQALATGEYEDPRMMRFNNTLAAIMLGLAQIAFLLSWSTLGWVFTVAVAVAAGVALAGFCVGCFIFTQYRIRTSLRHQKRNPVHST
ncbi:DUF4395 family protein [soil metagenome]